MLATLFLFTTSFPAILFSGQQQPALPEGDSVAPPFFCWRLQTTIVKSYQSWSFSDDLTDFISCHSFPCSLLPASLPFLLFLNMLSSFSPQGLCTCYFLSLESSIPQIDVYIVPHFIQPSLMTQLKISTSTAVLLPCV